MHTIAARDPSGADRARGPERASARAGRGRARVEVRAPRWGGAGEARGGCERDRGGGSRRARRVAVGGGRARNPSGAAEGGARRRKYDTRVFKVLVPVSYDYGKQSRRPDRAIAARPTARLSRDFGARPTLPRAPRAYARRPSAPGSVRRSLSDRRPTDPGAWLRTSRPTRDATVMPCLLAEKSPSDVFSSAGARILANQLAHAGGNTHRDVHSGAFTVKPRLSTHLDWADVLKSRRARRAAPQPSFALGTSREHLEESIAVVCLI